MSSKGHIVCLYNKNTKKRYGKMLEIMLWSAWFLLGAYTFWFVFKAKTFQPLTLDELALAWRLHKCEAKCKAPQIHDLLLRDDEVVGFKCGCGYEFLQKRLISQKVHPRAQNSKPLSIGEIEGLLQKRTRSTPDLGIRYLNTKRV
jgi:hypothetical protein